MNDLINNINHTFESLIAVFSETSDDSLNKIPFKGSWSIGQVAEHIILCGNGIPDNQTEISTRAKDEKVPMLKAIFLNMDEKSKADASLTPHRLDHTGETLIKKVVEIKEKLIGIAEERDMNALCTKMEFPTLGFLTRHEWLSFICFHTQRHIVQIENIIKHLKKEK